MFGLTVLDHIPSWWANLGGRSLRGRELDGSWSQCMQSQGAKRDKCQGSAPFLLLVQSGTPACGMVPPKGAGLIKIILHRHAQTLFSQVILDLIKLTIQIHRHNSQREKNGIGIYKYE